MEFKKICPSCKKEIVFNNKSNLERSLSTNSVCRSCCCTNRNKTFKYKSKEENSGWKSPNEIPYSWFSRYFERGNKKKRYGNITIVDVYDLWIKQDKKCNLSGLNIGFYDDKNTHTCSIDRIDSAKEYVLENIQLVHKDVNIMKNRFNQDYFVDVCNLIAKKNIS